MLFMTKGYDNIGVNIFPLKLLNEIPYKGAFIIYLEGGL